MYQNFIIPYLYEAQHVSDETTSIMRSLNCNGILWFFLRKRLLDLQLVDVVSYGVPDNVHKIHVQQPSTYKNQRLPVQF